MLQRKLALAHAPISCYAYFLILAGTHVTQTRYVNLHRTPRLVIEAPAGIPVHLDGEIFRADARRIEAEVQPERLQVITATDA